MIVKMKDVEAKCVKYAQRYIKGWDYFAVCTGAYLAGYKQAKADTTDGNNEVEVTLDGGTHQLAQQSFIKWTQQVRDLPFCDALRSSMEYYDIHDMRVVTDKDGLISFQGTCRKKV
jgi:hypothetical protein